MGRMRTLRLGAWGIDVALAAAFVVAGQYELRYLPDSGQPGGPLLLNSLLAFLCAAPLAIRRRWPMAALAVAAVPQVGASLLTVHALTFWGMGVPLAVLFYSVARWSGRRHAAWLALGTGAVVLAVYGIHVPDFVDVEEYLFGGLIWGTACLAGAVIAQLTRQRQALNAAMVLLRGQEHDRRQQLLADERARISREMHDVMAHGITLMVVQAGSARLELAPEAEKARESMLIVEQTGREVLAELRRTVDLLRSSDADPGGGPAPNLDALDALAAQMRAAGLDVRMEVAQLPGLDPGRALVVYRVIQEALTNSLRYAGPGIVSVAVTRPDDLHVEVVEHHARAAPLFPGTLNPGGGNGLAGLRERVGLFGGTLWAGAESGGFAVRARIPLEPPP